MRLGLGLGIDNHRLIGGKLVARFTGDNTMTATVAPITRQLTAAMLGEGTQSNTLTVTKKFTPNYTGDGTLAATVSTAEFLLDTYSGAAAAYSIRLLSSTYSGALVEIRRSSDNALKSFYPDSNNELSLNSEDGSSTTLSTWIGSDNGFIRTWFDQSGNSRDVVQNSASAQGQIVNAGALITKNSKAAIDFDQTNDLLSTSGNVNFGLNTSIFGVFTPDVAATGFDVVCKLGTDSSGNRRTFALFSGDIYASAFANNLNLGAFTANTQYIGRQYAESNDQYGAINGASLTSGTFTLNNPPSGTITIGSSTLSEFFGGNIQEIIMYDSTQRTNDSGINTNLNNYYNAY